ncbi:hypothetical protein FBUS_09772 [Fasciolopsis buskii]|uniref:Uncharacterized protein n=1 Tax=Fasciolopsis buskii TaxID=27845 RepID=A0A8E0VFI0_9TREM|nr:hypothetical protein FBUS_09772 [Fasciolopsis buski]
MVNRYRKEQERKREIELEKEKRQKLENMRKKNMLEFAYEGKHNEMRLLLQEMVPLQVATEGIIHELLDTWDVQETDRLLRQISVHREHRNEQYNKGAQALLDRYDSRSISPLMIHDAEFHLESEKLEMERALEKLQEAKLELREEERKGN